MPSEIPVRSGGDLARAHRHLRRAAGLTQKQLAERLQVDVQVVKRFEGGEPTQFFERLLLSLAELGVTVALEPR